MSPDRYVSYYKWIYISSPIYLLSLLGYKLSILLLYLRLFGVNTRFRYATWAVAFLVSGYVFANLWTQLFGCHPIAKFWQPKLAGHCMTWETATYAYGSLNVISDLFIFVLPLPMVWRLRLSRREKLGVTLVFFGGAM
ncbi:MAG: hypothetical protein HETSPECPRED_005455 [Heterodermia speciosa]|uniref:Rhodopsin domain-containing protein n=1 Tax=Heterodermia speciosa TaxID=116794 RepID=A0A8H3FDC6_9LECA|nr:MAG: hypothetical protein HETSPECPRED_005455 [Heterodermia speciosa]